MATDSRPVEEQDNHTPEPVLRLGRRNRKDDVEMDITPMIDVTFLLLIFFIVSSQLNFYQASPRKHTKEKYSTIHVEFLPTFSRFLQLHSLRPPNYFGEFKN